MTQPKGRRPSHDKGHRIERALLQDHSFGAERVPLSGAAGGGDYSGPQDNLPEAE